MNELIQSLIECLQKETAHYRNLSFLAEQQKDLLVAGQVEVLPENVRLEEKQVFSLGPVVSRRNELLGQMAQAYHLKNLSLAEALQRAPVECHESFKKAVVDLIQAAKQLEEINKSNEKLLNNALSYVDFTLRILANGGKKRTFSPSLASAPEEKRSSFVNRVV